MTFDTLEKRARDFDRNHQTAFWILLALAGVLAAIAAEVILAGNSASKMIAGACLAISLGLLNGARLVPRARSKKERLSKYVTHKLTEAAAAKRACVEHELQLATSNMHLQGRRMTRLLRNQRMIRELSLGKLVAKNKADIAACELSIARATQRKNDMQAELDGFNYELTVLVRKAEKAIVAHIANTTVSLIEKTEFAHIVNGLVKNASEL